MKMHVDHIGHATKRKNLWYGQWHHGDWLGLDAPEGSYVGSSNRDLIASAFYAYSTSLLVKAGKVIGKGVKRYEKLYENIVKTFNETFTEYKTQTECALALHFNLANNKEQVAKKLAELIINNGK
jgi:alpha-L-rhamnosidase